MKVAAHPDKRKMLRDVHTPGVAYLGNAVADAMAKEAARVATPSSSTARAASHDDRLQPDTMNEPFDEDDFEQQLRETRRQLNETRDEYWSSALNPVELYQEVEQRIREE